MRRRLEMKKKFLIVGDNHLDSRTPKSRLDNYMESSLMELKETLLIAKAAEVDYYIMLGDIFERIEVGGICRNRALEILLSDDGEPWPFEKYVVVGNHDIGHNPSNLNKSALETLIAANALRRVDEISDLGIRFLHFRPDLDDDLRAGFLSDIDSKILFCHASIVDQPSRFEHVLFSDLVVHENTKLIVSGHIHHPMESVSKTGVKFFNPGSLGRSKIDETHHPRVILLQYDYETDDIKHKYLMLKRALSSDIIFDLDKNNQRKFENKNTELFIEAITNVSITDSISSDLIQDLEVYAEKAKVEKEIINMAKTAINLTKTGGEF